MSIVSLTFHAPENLIADWDQYAKNDLAVMAENLIDAEKYIICDVHSDMVAEGKNTNLLIIFENQDKRKEFLESELKNIEDRIFSKFGDTVMIFQTLLNPKKSRF